MAKAEPERQEVSQESQGLENMRWRMLDFIGWTR